MASYPQQTVVSKTCLQRVDAVLKILSIETSRRQGSVAACLGDRLLREQQLDPLQRTARSLAPAIKRLLSDVGWSIMDVALVAVTQGPGSFTGLRIGVTTAKTLGYATGAGVMGLNTLEVMAAQLLLGTSSSHPADPHDVILNAHRNQLFTARYRRQERRLLRELPTRIVDREAWLQDHPLLIAGALEQAESLPTAAMVGQLAAWRSADPGQWPEEDMTWAEAGDTHQLMAMVPRYYRQSAAEEKRDGNSPGSS
ncbi:MAG: tRNA (adenosine(37)-N6)-threonylcarbamoyltransferase complex dimerization subunit type 1 TsaB [Planctomycetota bacterium]|nr:tRNA (adenosine(37)-N6)-threonylcarbamoyltransferase complex dimerization subunit type 1 TsaB [Planctomycetota bacterium]